MTVKWQTAKPPKDKSGVPCIVTTLCSDKRTIVQVGWAGWGDVMRGTIAHMDMPIFDPKQKSTWMSEYRGDDLPKESDRYIVAVEKSYGIITCSRFVWFNATKGSWGRDDVIAWHPVPIAYKGEKRLIM